MKRKFWIVRWEVSENGWGVSDFETEIYSKQPDAEARAAELNKEKPPHCGYWFTSEPATLVK